MSKQKQKKQFYLLSLGCSKNTVDSDSMASLLQRAGFSGVEDPNDANVAYMYELYVDGDALQAHSTSDVMKQIMNAFGGVLAGRPELTMLTPVRGKGL